MKKSFLELGKELSEDLLTFLKKIAEEFGDAVLEKIINGIASLRDTFFIQGDNDTVREIDTLTYIFEQAQTLFSHIGDFISDAAESLLEVAGQALETVMSWLGSVVNFLGEQIANLDLGDAIGGFLESLF